MWTTLLVAFPLTLADPPPATEASPDGEVRVAAEAATHCASSAKLIGDGCSYTTGLMARRVMEQGADWTAEGALVSATTHDTEMVAAPFTMSDDATVRVLATEILDTLTAARNVGPTLALTGRLMEVDGVRYVVLTSYRVIPAR